VGFRTGLRDKILGFASLPEDGSSPQRYRTLRRNISILMLFVTIVPLTSMAVINYYEYRKALKREIVEPLKMLVSKTRHSFSLFLEERLSTVRFVASAYSFDQLSDEKTLNRIFRVLKKEFGGFVDLGLIDQSGTQISYAGPYELLGKSYLQQAWLHEVMVRGVYISDVFLGYRKFPHVALAVQRFSEDGSFWVLRATIDTERFDNLIASMGLDPETDAFLVNDKGVLQTSSKYYGKVLERCALAVPVGIYGTFVKQEVDPGGQEVLIAGSHLRHPAYTLVVVKRSSGLLKSWYTLKSEMFLIFVGGVAAIMVLVLRLTASMVKRMRDADERREIALRGLEHSNKLSSIGRLAAGVAHEVNNPMAIINEKAGLMKDIVQYSTEFEQKEKFLELLSSIISSVQRCKTVTHRLLGFARRMDVQLEELDLNGLLQEVLGFLAREASYRNINVSLHFASDLPRIFSDRGQLQQVFLNILTNAMAAVDDGGEIVITTWEEDIDTVAVSIMDNGCGMSGETMRHIFEPFFTTKRGYGTGLGLPITYGIVKKLGGDIKVQSKESEGTTFTVYLPKKAQQQVGG